MAVLIGMSSTVKGKKFNLDEGETFVGRQSQNHVPIEDASISGRHCSIQREDRRYTLLDLGSTNGTRLNGARINRASLKPKDIIQIGGIEMMFDGQDVDVASDEAAASAVEVIDEPISVPENFHTSSPFGAQKDNRKMWWIGTSVLIVLVVAALVFFVVHVI